MKLKAVFFDLDDTLYSDFHECDDYGYKCMGSYAEKEFGIPQDEFIRKFRSCRQEFGRRQPGMPPTHNRLLVAQITLEHLGLNPVKYARRLHRIYWDALFTKMELRPGAIDLLSELRASGIKTAICTDMLADIQLEKMEYLGIDGSIDYLVSSEEAGVDKPAAPIFWLALHKCNCLPEEAVMIGDNFKHDVQGAIDLGIGGIWLNWSGLPHPDDGRGYFEARTFIDAADHVRQLLQGQ